MTDAGESEGFSFRFCAKEEHNSDRLSSFLAETGKIYCSSSSVRWGADSAGGPSRIICTLEPPTPKELTPANLLPSSVSHGRSSAIGWKGVVSNGMRGFGLVNEEKAAFLRV